MIYIFEIYDSRIGQWYVDYKTKDIDIANEYFDILLKTYPKKNIKIITRLDVGG